MKTNRNLFIGIVAVLVTVAVWLVAEAGVKSETSIKSNKSSKQNAEGAFITPEDHENFIRIINKSRIVHKIRNQVDILKGLGAISVLVEGITPDIERLGLTRQALQTDVELLLRKYGIEVEKDMPLRGLYIVVTAMPKESGIIAYTISVEFYDVVIPVRNPTIMIIGATVWQNSGGVGIVGTNRIRRISEDVEGHVKEFINDYLAANPKEQ